MKTVPWEPLKKLEIAPIDFEGEIYNSKEQNYGAYVIGFNLNDSEFCYSVIEVCTGESMEADRILAEKILKGLKLLEVIETLGINVYDEEEAEEER